MMRELRKLKVVLDRMRLNICSEWIHSVPNTFSEAFSLHFPRDSLQMLRELQLSVYAGMSTPEDAFLYRPVGEHPVQLRRQDFSDLSFPWAGSEVILLCTQV